MQPIRKKQKLDKKDSFSFHELSRVCKFIKIDFRTSFSSGEATIVVDIFGINDIALPSSKSDGNSNLHKPPFDTFSDWLPKLKVQSRAIEEKHHILSDDFTAKRRKLTTLCKLLYDCRVSCRKILTFVYSGRDQY